ncbi:MAG: DUF4320 family protein [Flavonifractor plautii]
MNSATNAKAADLRRKQGLTPDISWSDTGKIQLGNEVTVTLTTTVNLRPVSGSLRPSRSHSVRTGHRSLGGVLEMNRLETVLKDRSGQGTPMSLAVVVCCLILAISAWCLNICG